MAASVKGGSASGTNRRELLIQDSDREETMTVNLMDPEDVMSKIDLIDDKATEVLLRQAYQVNRQLKNQLTLGKHVMNNRMTTSAFGRATQHRPTSNISYTGQTRGDHTSSSYSRVTSAASMRSARNLKPHANEALQMATVSQPATVTYHSQLKMNDV